MVGLSSILGSFSSLKIKISSCLLTAITRFDIQCTLCFFVGDFICENNNRVQWCSKALMGPGSTVTWGPSAASAPSAEAGSPEC